jgi:hypothetical protein
LSSLSSAPSSDSDAADGSGPTSTMNRSDGACRETIRINEK